MAVQRIQIRGCQFHGLLLDEHETKCWCGEPLTLYEAVALPDPGEPEVIDDEWENSPIGWPQRGVSYRPGRVGLSFLVVEVGPDEADLIAARLVEAARRAREEQS